MADNVAITAGSGTTIATEDVSGVQHQKVKMEFGGDGVATLVSASDPLPVTGTFYQTTQPISAVSLPLPTGAATSSKQDTGNTSLGTIAGAISGTEMQVDVITMPTTTVQSTNLDIRDLSSATDSVTVTGTVTANAGTNLNTSLLALESGGNLATIAGKDFATQTTLAAINTKLVTGTDIGDVTINNTTTTPVPVQPPASGYLNISIDQTGNNNAVDVLTISAGDNNIGNVDIASSLPSGTNYVGKFRPTDGTTDAEIIPLTGYNAQAVGIVDGSGNQITSFGGGTQYTEGDTDASITGTALMFETNTGTNAIGVVSSTNPLPVLASIDTTGLATDTKQDTGNTSLSNIDTKTPSLGQAVMASSSPVVIASNQTAIPVSNSTAGNLKAEVVGTGTFAVQADTELPNAAALADATANPSVPAVGAFSMAWNGATWDRLLAEGNANDGESTHSTGVLAAETYPMTWNGATFDRRYSVTNGMNSTGTGITSAGIVAQVDDTSPGAVSENQFGPVRMSTRRALLVEGVASGTAQPMSVASGGIASGAIASGAIASGAIAAGAIAAGATAIAANEDDASAANDRLVKIAAIRLDTPVANANVSANGDYTQLGVDNTQKLWVTGTYAEDTAHTDADRIVANGTRRIDTAATSAGTSGDYATLDSSAEGALWATLTPTTTSGCSLFRSIDLDETEEDVKTTAGNLYGYYFANTNAAARYLKLYNATAANVTVGTTAPVATFYLPPTSAGHVGLPFPISFATAICAAATTGVADNDTGAPGNNEVLFMAWYK